MSSDRQPPLSLVRHLVVGNLDKPLFELIDGTLACLVRGLDARAAFYGKIHDSTRSQPHRGLPMRQQLGIVSYLGVSLRTATGEVFGTLAVLGEGPRIFTDADQDLLLVVAGLLESRLRPDAQRANGQSRT